MFTSLRDGWRRNAQHRDQARYEAGLQAVAPTPERSRLTEHLALWDHWSRHITFQHYRASVAESVAYHGDYARAASLLDALRSAHGVLYRGETALVNEELRQPVDRENTLEYFLTDHNNRVLNPAVVFPQIHELLSQIDSILLDLDDDEKQARLAPYYRLKYDALLKAGITALATLVRVSDLYLETNQ